MSFWRYIFSFLYVRNWYTGRQELSRPRLFIFISGLVMLLIAILIVTYLQAGVVYERT